MTIKILAAIYYTTKTGIDVTSIVQKLADDGNINIVVNNRTMGKDPDYGTRKMFSVIYELEKGRFLTAECYESQTVEL